MGLYNFTWKYEAPFPYVQPQVEEPVPQTDQFQFYTNSYGNYPSYGYDYEYNNQYHYTAQPQLFMKKLQVIRKSMPITLDF